MNTRPLVQFPEEQNSPFGMSSRLRGTHDSRARLLELRSESGTVYVCLSRWQRFRLLWTFRHFHVLPQQVLSRRDQHLIEKLSRSGVIKTTQPVPRNAVLGVVERPRSPSRGSAPHVVTMPTERTVPQTWRANPRIPGLPTPGLHQRLFFDKPVAMRKPTKRETRLVPGARFRQWGALGLLMAACLVVILTKSLIVPRPARMVQISKALPPSAPVLPTAKRALPPAARVIEKPKHRLVQPSSAAFTIARSDPPVGFLGNDVSAARLSKPVLIAPAPVQRPFVAELPQGHFAAPIAADPNRVGELHLRALIAADGSVKNVTVVSGDPKLAAAGMRAVRRWHYNPYEASATQAERETLINMKFFGQDAVSVTAVAR